MVQNPIRDVVHHDLVHVAGLEVLGRHALAFPGDKQVVQLGVNLLKSVVASLAAYSLVRFS